MDRIANYIADLKSSTSLMRKFAARNLRREFDERAVLPLIDALRDSEREVRREAAETLGHIGRQEAADALREASRDPDPGVAAAAAKALGRLPGKKTKRQTQSRTHKTDRLELIRKALSDTGSAIEQRPYGFKVVLRLVSGRKQVVKVAFDKPDPEGSKLIVMYTICGPAEESKYGWALTTNSRLSCGAIAVRRNKGQNEFILLDRVPEEGADPLDLRKRLLSLAEKGDAIEEKLTGLDRN